MTITSETGGSVTLGTSGQYAAGVAVNITATANQGYKFSHWSTTDGGAFGNPTSSSTTFTMPEGATTIRAHFTHTGDTGALYGDINGDGRVNLADLILLLRHFSRPNIDINAAGADVNADGVVNNADLNLLLRYFARPNIRIGP